MYIKKLQELYFVMFKQDSTAQKTAHKINYEIGTRLKLKLLGNFIKLIKYYNQGDKYE